MDERKVGHKALKIKDGELIAFDPHPEKMGDKKELEMEFDIYPHPKMNDLVHDYGFDKEHILNKQMDEKVRECNSTIEGDDSWKWKEFDSTIIDLQDAQVRISTPESLLSEREKKIEELEKWVDDLQSGMFINCVYCGHRYPPGTNAVKRKILYEHIQICPKHPLSRAEARVKELEDGIEKHYKENKISRVESDESVSTAMCRGLEALYNLLPKKE